MGLIQRAIEAAGIPTVGLSLVREYSEKIRPPRTVHLRWPFGHPLGEPFRIDQQTAVLVEALAALYSIDQPGTIIDLPWRWKRERYRSEARMKLKNLGRERPGIRTGLEAGGG